MGASHSSSHSPPRRGPGDAEPDIEAPPPPSGVPRWGGDGSLEDAIEGMVAEFMESGATNSAYVPDYIESRMYRNGLRMGLGLLRGFLGTLRVEVAGLRVSVNVE
jgi:hypothetical protein